MSKRNFKIIQFNPKYQKAVVDLVGELLVYTGVIPKEDLPINDDDLYRIPDFYDGRGGFWLAVDEEKLIGVVGIKEIGGKAKLKRMFVLPKYHGSGVGQELLNYAINQAHEQGFTQMILNTNEHMTRAHHFYEKNGFVKTGQDGTQLHYERDIHIKFLESRRKGVLRRS